MPEDQLEAKDKDKSQAKDNIQSISPLLITGLLAILGTVTGELTKGYWSSTLADKDFQSKLILDALKSNDIEERRKSLQFLVTTNLIFDPKIREGISQSIEENNIPQFRPNNFSDSPGVSVIPSAREQLINRDPTLQNSILVLVGLKVKHGDIIDSITPIFAEITPNLQIVKTIEGQRIGGADGGETLLEREGYIITGIKLHRGYYFGRDEVIHIEVTWNRLTPKGIDTNDQQVSERLGSGQYATPSQVRELRAEPDHYISDLRSNISSHTSGETFLNDVNIQQEKLPLNN